MSDKLKFYYHQGVIYNLHSVVKIQKLDVCNYEVTFINNEVITINTGHIKFKDIIEILNDHKGLEFFI